MKLELITKSYDNYIRDKKYCEEHGLKFVDLGIQKSCGNTEYLFDIIGSAKKIREFEDNTIIVY